MLGRHGILKKDSQLVLFLIGGYGWTDLVDPEKTKAF